MVSGHVNSGTFGDENWKVVWEDGHRTVMNHEKGSRVTTNVTDDRDILTSGSKLFIRIHWNDSPSHKESSL